MKRLATLFVLMSVMLSGCSQDSSNDAAKKPSPSKLEQIFQDQTTNEEARSEARQAVLEFIQANIPSWNVKGLSAQPYAQNIFGIDADLEKNGRHLVISFDTRKFFPESGEPYWLPTPMSKFRRERLRDLSEDALIKEINRLRESLDERQSSSDDDR